ncbi:hypothetical protein ACFOOL_16035 [Devosia honganensis]|uniref:Uncharacterized protein n=1 Tax=Devosia honganensis TaxID=1610527 RepID=A0ABV7X525_9HYPH
MSAPTISTIVWQGICLTIRHQPDWAAGFDHIEITSERRLPFPISETGYRSHFLHGEDLKRYGDAQSFVTAWLAEAEQSPAWRRIAETCRQPSLF